MTTKAGILHAIRQKCLDCSGYQPGEVRDCPLTHCGLWPYRMGRDPAPSQHRGFAKPPVCTGDSVGNTTGGDPGSARPALRRQSPLGRIGFDEGEPVPGDGSDGFAVATPSVP